jgi:hypothetical protein
MRTGCRVKRRFFGFQNVMEVVFLTELADGYGGDGRQHRIGQVPRQVDMVGNSNRDGFIHG